MKFFSTLAFLALTPSVAFGNDDVAVTAEEITVTCREYCANIVNTQLPTGKCSGAHSAGSKYAYPICIDALRRGVTAACMPTCSQIGGESMMAAGATIDNFSEAFPAPVLDVVLDCKPSDVPQVKPRFFREWCNMAYKSTFDETILKVRTEVVELFYQGDEEGDGETAADAAAAAATAAADRIATENAATEAVAAAAAEKAAAENAAAEAVAAAAAEKAAAEKAAAEKAAAEAAAAAAAEKAAAEAAASAAAAEQEAKQNNLRTQPAEATVEDL